MKLVRRSQPAAELPAVHAPREPTALHVASSDSPLHIKLRPKTLGEIIGQDAAVASIDALFKTGRVPHFFVFGGPSGTGKTTLARILGSMIGCSEIIEHDAGRVGGVDEMRALIDAAQYMGLGKNPGKFIIIDEAHAVSSKAAFNALLKATEEPPAHLYWAFCTTEPERLPKALQTRGHMYNLSAVPWEQIADYLVRVIEDEQLSIMPDFIDVIARRAEGSVRQALVYASMLQGITDADQRDVLLAGVDAENDPEVGTLCYMLVTGKGATWPNVCAVLNGLSAMNAEGIRLAVLAYATKAAMGGSTKALAVIQAFSAPCNPAERMAPIVLAAGGLILGE